ncbi:MAG TPA: HTTM domain-containing protein [Isosphaeraceae bacterium]|nr:HTTM domain-containing protein [Isosphaeraceae bacterium]
MNPIRAWNDFWFRPISARPLGAFRIIFGLVVLLNLALLSLELDYWFTDHGLLQGTEAREAAGPLRPSLLQHVQDPVSVRVFFGAMAAVVVLFTLGWHTRLMGVLLYLGMLSIHHRNISSANGADVLLIVLAFYAMLCPCGAAYSLDARRASRKRGGTLAEPLIVPWAQRLIQIELTLVYLNTALLKAGGSSWQDGTALHFVLNNAEVRRFSLGLPNYPLLINFMTYGALMVEFTIPFLIWFKKARPWVMFLGVGLHATIGIFVNIPIFGELMIASYLTFLGPDEFDRFLRYLNPRNWFRKAAAVPVDPTGRAALGIAGRFDTPSEPAGPHWVSQEVSEADLEHAGFRREWDDAP